MLSVTMDSLVYAYEFVVTSDISICMYRLSVAWHKDSLFLTVHC